MLHSGCHSFDEDSQQEQEDLIPVFAMNLEENFKNSNNNASSFLNNLESDNEKSYDTRDPPSAEQLVLNRNDWDTNENGGGFKLVPNNERKERRNKASYSPTSMITC
jgi:hypothetical protein